MIRAIAMWLLASPIVASLAGRFVAAGGAATAPAPPAPTRTSAGAVTGPPIARYGTRTSRSGAWAGGDGAPSPRHASSRLAHLGETRARSPRPPSDRSDR